MAGEKFSSFDNTTTPATTDFVVGYKPGTPNLLKRWTLGAFKTFWQGILNITRLDREQTNYVDVTGAGTGSAVTVAAGGGDANINIKVKGKGTGVVELDSDVQLNGNDLTTEGGALNTAGGGVNLSGGTITTGNGTVNMGSGVLNLAGGALNLTSTSSISISGSGDITVDNGDIKATSGGVYSQNLYGIGGGNINTQNDLVAGADAFFPNNTKINVLLGYPKTIKGSVVDAVTVSDAAQFSDSVYVTQNVEVTGDVVVTGDITTDSYVKGSIEFGQTADPGSAQGNGLIANEANIYSTVATVGDCATLPALATGIGPFVPDNRYYRIFVRNDDAANAMDIFPSSGGQINGLAVDAAYSLAQGAQAIFIGTIAAAGDRWWTIG